MISTADILNARILIVDDQQENLQLLEQMLKDEGYLNVSSTSNPFEVCGLHRNNKYDLIMLDLKMPGKDGFQVMEDLKKIREDDYLSVLVITAQPDQKLLALLAGAKDFISKPFDIVEAKIRIHNLLEVRLLNRQLEHYNQILESSELTDPLTGLPNRRLLLDRLSLSIAHARRNRNSTALLYLNLKDFKQIYKIMGNVDGDALLNMVAIRLQETVRQEDTVAHLSNDEFVISLWELSQADGLNGLVSRILHNVSAPYRINDINISLTASIEISIYPANTEPSETLMTCAYKALHEAKRNVKNEPVLPATPVFLRKHISDIKQPRLWEKIERNGSRP